MKFIKGHTPASKGKKLLRLRGKNACHWMGGKKKKICVFCQKEFYVFKGRENTAEFCSRSCLAKYRKGDKSANWKGGIDLENKRVRHSLEYEVWRMEVYKKDMFKCRLCGKKDIVAHHLKLFSEFPELRFSVDNGITLCRSCHKKVHREIGYKTRFKKVLTIA